MDTEDTYLQKSPLPLRLILKPNNFQQSQGANQFLKFNLRPFFKTFLDQLFWNLRPVCMANKKQVLGDGVSVANQEIDDLFVYEDLGKHCESAPSPHMDTEVSPLTFRTQPPPPR